LSQQTALPSGRRRGDTTLEAERQTSRRRYVILAGGDDSFAALKLDERFEAQLSEFPEPAKAKP
jgi:hypothetical protein